MKSKLSLRITSSSGAIRTATVCLLFFWMACGQQSGKTGAEDTERSDLDSLSVLDGQDAYEDYFLFEGDDLQLESLDDEEMQIDDEFSKRYDVYSSANKAETLMHVKVRVVENKPSFYFIGAERPPNPDTVMYAHVYELNADFTTHVIDSFPILASYSEMVSYKNDDAFSEFLLRQFDNLIIEDSVLYYYKENDYTKLCMESGTFIYDRAYYKYVMGSKLKPVKVQSELFHYTNRMKLNPFERAVFSPDKSLLAHTDTYLIDFKSVTDWKREVDLAYARGMKSFRYNDPRVEFRLSRTFMEAADDSVSCKTPPLFGGMCWHDTKPTFYFDNSGECYACIWMIDLLTKKVTKM